ncbi:hypothetical protein [Cohnella sp. GCM10012308]|uniref:hypothetical protein n=1 Tax=Cohnella sp. GCM10012308 TaxID=3317329 RepID=UPI00361318DE
MVTVTTVSSNSNDTYTGATQINYDSPVLTAIETLGDVDFYKYTATGNGIEQVNLTVPAGKNYDVIIYDSGLKPLSAGIKDASESEEVIYKVISGATYYIKVFGVNSNYGNEFYTLKLSRAPLRYQTSYEYDANGNLKRKVTTILQS